MSDQIKTMGVDPIFGIVRPGGTAKDWTGPDWEDVAATLDRIERKLDLLLQLPEDVRRGILVDKSITIPPPKTELRDP